MNTWVLPCLICSVIAADNKPEPVNLGEWNLSVHPDASARFEGRVAIRVTIDKFEADKSYYVHLRSSKIAVDPSNVYTLSFRARADSERPVEIALTQNGAPYSGLTPLYTAKVGKEWAEHSVTLSPYKAEEDASLRFNLGGSGIAVELAAIKLEVVKRQEEKAGPSELPQPPPSEPLKKWDLTFNKESKARMVADPSSPSALKIVIDEAKTTESWQIGIRTVGLSFEAENEYTLTFAARAETWRKVDVVFSQARPPWKQVRWAASIEVGPEWQQYSITIRPLYTEHDAQIQFNLGLSEADTEFRDFGLTSVRQETVSQQENRFQIKQWQLAAEPGVVAELKLNEPQSLLAVRIDKSTTVNPEDLVLSYAGLKLRAHREYRLRFQAKAEANRTARLSMVDDKQPPQPMGFDRIITIGDQWEEFGLMFTPGRTNTECELRILLGESDADIELADITLEYVPVSRVDLDRSRSYWINAVGIAVTVILLGFLAVRDIIKRRHHSADPRSRNPS